VGTNAVGGGFGIWHWTGTTWASAPGGAVRVAVDRNGVPWIINSNHQILSYVDADITIGPSATDEVGQVHTFVVTVKAEKGGAGLQPVAGVFPTVTLSPTPGAATDNCAAVGTDASGQCAVVISSSVGGTVTANARASVTVGEVTLSPDTAANSGPGGSGPATETYVPLTSTSFLTGVSAGGRFLVDQNGQPFLVNGDSDWNLAFALSPADQNTVLADRHANGFNTVLTDLVSMTGAANYEGDQPFSGSDFTPNPAYWSKIDTFFQEAKANGITVFALPVDSYSIGMLQPMTVAQAQSFGTYLSDRYPKASYPNIVWMFGNDWAGDGAGCCNQWPWPAWYASLMAGLQSNGPRLTTVENGYWESLSSDGQQFGPTVAINWAYSYHPTYEDVLRGYAAKAEPVVFGEGAYENPSTGFPGTPLDLRKQLAWTMTSGGAGSFYGNDSLWQFSSGWQSQLDTTIVAQRKALDSVFAGMAWQNLQPDTSNLLVTAGRGGEDTALSTTSAPDTNDPSTGWYVTAAYTADGTLAVIYNPDTTSNSITLSPALLGPNPQITAIDPTNGARTSLGWTTHPTMGANAGGDHDWLYIINASPRT
jgi:hypothetical protein